MKESFMLPNNATGNINTSASVYLQVSTVELSNIPLLRREVQRKEKKDYFTRLRSNLKIRRAKLISFDLIIGVGSRRSHKDSDSPCRQR